MFVRFFVIGTLFLGFVFSVSTLGQINPSPGSQSRSYPLTVSGSEAVGFTALNAEGELTSFGNTIPVSIYRTNQIVLNGSGVSLGDVNLDGRLDIFATSVAGTNALLLNQGNWEFVESGPDQSFALPSAYSTGSVLADLDGDRDFDLLVSTLLHGTFVFENDGKGHYVDVTERSGVRSGVGGMSITVGDYDGDGKLDFYVTNYRASALMDVPNARMNLGVKNGKKIITDFNGRSISEPDLVNRFYIDERGGIGEYGEVDHLFRNLGELRFERVSFTGGNFLDEDGRALTAPPYDWGLAATFRDIDQDGDADLYVCNDFDTPDRIWMNLGDGRFQAMRKDGLRQSSWFSMGVDFADINRDGWDDFLTLDMLGSTHEARMTQLLDVAPAQHVIKDPLQRPQFLKTCLFLNEGDGTYSEVSQFAGLAATDWAWCPAFLDVDLDGWEDLLVTNGNERDGRNLDVAAVLKQLRAQQAMSDDRIFTERMRFPRLPVPNQAYRNNRDGTFTELGAEWGFAHDGVSHGMALGDLDGDGDLDLVVNHLNEPLGLYRNETTRPRIGVRLVGSTGNTAGIGARVFLRSGDHRQAQEIMAGGRYLSSDEPMRVFGVPEAETQHVLEVDWPSGERTVVSDVQANRLYELIEPVPSTETKETINASDRPNTQAWFEDISHRVNYTHSRQAFDDFSRQPLLFRRYGDMGPGVSWYDVDSDGYDDLVIGAGRGGKVGIFRNNEGGAFHIYERAPFDRPLSRDSTSLLGVSLRPSDPSLIIGLSNYEDGLALGASVGQYRFRSKAPNVVKGGHASSVGPMAFADWDRVGDLDLFVGGRFVPGRIPESPQSFFIVNDGGKLKVDDRLSSVLGSLGMVSGAVFTDVDGDLDPDLICSIVWGSPELLLNEAGRFERTTEAWNLSEFRGWWNGVQAGDFNADGRMDFVASNWGLNTPYRRYEAEPMELYWGDLDENGQNDLVMGAVDPDAKQRVPIRQLGTLVGGIPGLNQIYRSHQSFAETTSAALLEGLDAKPRRKIVNWFRTTVFLNDGTKFVAMPLPDRAQWSPAFGVSVADFDGDGNEDLFLAQNYFGIRNDVSRYDAGRGLLLTGRGDGSFDVVASRDSGLRILGEQRGCAVADLDHDGRVDLAVGQNGGALKLYRNARAKPGLRVSLEGKEGNAAAVGAGMWLSGDDVRGPRREVRVGSGYFSQDAATQVLSIPGIAKQIRVDWPDGEQSVHSVNPGDRSMKIRYDGSVDRE